MNNYDEFISQVSITPDLPQNAYGKVRFRIIAGKVTLPAATAAFLFFLFAGIVSFSANTNKQMLDWNFGSEEIVFSQNNAFYTLYDE